MNGSNLDNLYRQVIMEHYKNPRNKGLKGYKSAHIKNPSCGDDITIEADLVGGKIIHLNHDGTGCSICCSSASVMCELLEGKSVEDAKRIIKKYNNMIKGEEIEDEDELEEALVYQGVCKFPARVKCATISWKALEKLVSGDIDE